MMGNTVTITETNKQEELVKQSDRLQKSQQLRQLSGHLFGGRIKVKPSEMS